MSEQRRPGGPYRDPVRVNADGRVWYYPSGVAGVGIRASKRCASAADAATFAAVLRAEFGHPPRQTHHV